MLMKYNIYLFVMSLVIKKSFKIPVSSYIVTKKDKLYIVHNAF